MASLGIGLVTYKRPDLVMRSVERLRKHTTIDFTLVVADDGSADDTVEILRKNDVEVITGHNRGVCWNKNRALFYLSQIKRCDVVLIMEDDTYPEVDGWQAGWVDASLRWGHVNYAGDWFTSHFQSGSGSADDPIHSNATSGQCTGFSNEAVSYVGFLDTRFRGYGFGHVEHSRRMIRAGYGGFRRDIGNKEEIFYLLKSALYVDKILTHKNPADLTRNAELFREIVKESVYRAPWRDDEEMALFRSEMIGNRNL